MKPLIASRTFWGAVSVILGMVVQQFGLPIAQEELDNLVALLFDLFGVIMVIYGRFKAVTPIGSIF